MEANKATRGHMNYNDPPTFDSTWKWEEEEKQRVMTYEDDLYKFDDDKIVVANLIGDEPIGHIYKNGYPDDEGDEAENDTYEVETPNQEELHQEGFLITGNTYPFRHEIKEELNGRWDKTRKCWIIPVDKESQARAFADKNALMICKLN